MTDPRRVPGPAGAGAKSARAATAALLSVAVASWAGCGGGDRADAPAGETPVAVGVWTVRSEPVDVRVHWGARLEPLRTSVVQAPRNGVVTAVQVRDGDLARAGQELVRMVGPDLEARREALSERMEQIELELERWERLAAAGAAGPGEVAEARLRLLQAREQFAELEALAESYVIRAPAAGRVYGATLGRGSQVSAGETLLVVEDDASWGVRLSVAAWEAPRFDRLEDLTVRDDRGNVFPVVHIAFASEPQPGFVRIDLYVDGAGSPRRGADVEYHTSDDRLLVPWTALAGEEGRHWVARVVSGEPPTIERRPVELGRPGPEGVEVVAGLEAGDRIVRFEPRSHPEGRAVTPVERDR